MDEEVRVIIMKSPSLQALDKLKLEHIKLLVLYLNLILMMNVLHHPISYE